MIHALHDAFWLTLFCLGMVFFGFVWLFITTRRRHWWLRYTAWEEAFYLKIGMSKKFADSSRRFGESHWHIWFQWFVIVTFLVLLFFSGKLFYRATPGAMFEDGRNLYRAGRYSEAIGFFNAAIKFNPNYAEAYYFRGASKEELELYSDAITDLTKAIDLDPKYTAAYNRRSLTKRLQGDYFGAVSDCDKAIELDPKYAPAYNSRGLAEDNLRKYKQAMVDYNQTIVLNATNAFPYNNRGYVKLELKDYAGAIADFTKAIELSPKFAAAYNSRGDAKRAIQDYDGAITDYSNAVEIYPQFYEAQTNQEYTENLRIAAKSVSRK